jgi:hypothetical protein
LACININCCGALANIYDRPILALAGISFTFIVYAFYLAIFSFQLSAKDKGDKPLHRTQQLFLIILFIVLLLVGTILVAVNKGTFGNNRQQLPGFSNSATLQEPTADLETGNGFLSNLIYDKTYQKTHDTVTVKPAQTEAVYPSKQLGECLAVPDFFTVLSQATTGTLLFGTTVKAAAANTFLPSITVISQFTDFNTLTTSDPNCATASTCSPANLAIPGYIFLLLSTPVTATDKNSITFQFSLDGDSNSNDIRILSGEAIAKLNNDANGAVFGVSITAATTGAPAYHVLGLIGKQTALSAAIAGTLGASSGVNFCNLFTESATGTATFTTSNIIVRAFPVDLAKYGFVSQTTTPAPTASM